MELYETTTNGTKPSTVSLNHMGLNHHKGGINETSISGGEDELISNKSDDRFSGQTDYEMVTYHLFMIFFYLKLTFLFFFGKGNSTGIDDDIGQSSSSSSKYASEWFTHSNLDVTGNNWRYEYILDR